MFARLALTTTPTIALGIMAIALPAVPLQSQLVSAESLRIGDTASIVIQVDSPQSQPVVKMGSKTYPAFSIGGNRYRVMIPSTPLEKAGVRKVQVTADGKTQEVPVKFASRSFRDQSTTRQSGGRSYGIRTEAGESF
jgi:hypothetical protein